jgi:hypothetical protein
LPFRKWERGGSVENESLLDLMTRQLEEAEAELVAQERRSEPTEATSSLIHSLRVSLRIFSSGVDPDDEASTSFLLTVTDERRLVLRMDRHFVHLSGAYLPSVLGNAGIILAPGQSLVLDPGFALRLIEESLGESASEQRRQDQRRGELQGALRQSAGRWRDELQLELRRLALRDADLLQEKLELAELHAAASEWIGEGKRLARGRAQADSGVA